MNVLNIPEKAKVWMGLILLTLSLAIIYLPTYRFEYLAIDDTMHTEKNINLSPLTFKNISAFWMAPHENAYMPVAYTTWMILASLGKKNTLDKSDPVFNSKGEKYSPGVFHLANVFIHLLSSLLIFNILNMLFKDLTSALLGALFFALHPVQVEPTCWITGLRDVLAGLFSFISLYLFLIFHQKKNYFLYSLSLFSFILGVLSKSSAAVLPIFILLITLFFYPHEWKKNLLLFLPWLLIIFPIFYVFKDLNNSVATKIVYQGNLSEKIWIALDALGFYIKKLIIPFPLLMDYGRNPFLVLQQQNYLFHAIIFIIFSLLIYFFLVKKQARILFLGWLIFLIGLIPVLGIQPFIFQHISTVADRYLYLSLLGGGLIFGYYFKSYPNWGVTLLILYFTLSFFQVRQWENNEKLFSHNLKYFHNSWLSLNNLGVVMESKGEYEEAAELYGKSAQITSISSSWNNRGAALLKAKKYSEAIEAFQLALRTSSFSDWAYNNLGAALAFGGKKKIAKETILKAMEKNPFSSIVKENLKVLDDNKSLTLLRIQRSSEEQ